MQRAEEPCPETQGCALAVEQPLDPREALVVAAGAGDDVVQPVELPRPPLPSLETNPDLRVGPAMQHLDKLALPESEHVLHVLGPQPRLPAGTQQAVAEQRGILLVDEFGVGRVDERGAARVRCERGRADEYLARAAEWRRAWRAAMPALLHW
eukprot:scaffold59238_cov27-Tisochrysis_lutea.AAC.11